MTDASMIPVQILARIGAIKIRTAEVTARDIRRFAQAIGAGEAETLEDGRLVAPPLFCQAFMFEDVPAEALPADGSPIELDLPLPVERTVGGGSDFEILGPVYSGDTLTIQTTLKDVATKQGRSGTLFLIVVETCFQNQRGQTVARETATYVKR